MNKNDIFPSKYLSAADLPEEGMTVTIRSVTEERMQDGERKPIMAFVEAGLKCMIVNVTKWNTLAKLYGDESDDWYGKRIKIRPGEVKFKGEMVACIDVSSRKPDEPKLAAKNGKTPKGSPEAEKAIAAAVQAGPDEGGDDDDTTPF